MVNVVLAPSILSYDSCDLVGGVKIIESSGARWIHVDVMDGHFVDNISFGPKLVSDLRKHTNLFLDVHLMLEYPNKYAKRFIQAGADAITIHQEANCDVRGQLRIIKEHGCLCGLAVNPETVPNFELVRLADIVLAMGVFPGFGGQKFMPEVCSKISLLHNFRSSNKLSYKISVDGGINADIAKDLASIGMDIIVSGSAFFSDPRTFQFCLS
ncbi:MAG: ribulose-phosphate 3-epimerase [Puniceicoccales bacterium]|jgi:ribulose-phosphate 3-epimerase|nr:ribulose-phosphate 3-epimerase [Puniceicoccales bacterium]